MEHMDGTDHFERRLTRLMRESEQYAPFEPRHRQRLRAGVRARRRVRAAQRTAGSALVVATLGLGLLFLPGRHVRNEPGAPVPRPDSVPSPSVPSPSFSSPPGATPSAAPSTRGAPTSDADPATVPPLTTTVPPAATTRWPSSSIPTTSPVSQSPPGTSATPTAPPPTETSRTGPTGHLVHNAEKDRT
ncbi:hypothetical protein [Streptomyces sp. NPDC018610]|uniref:hypothetical protein n=1 Tax=Streptomyces sp. NPDC018610 TaxID=3365049 RepID=UPI00379DE385